MVAIAKRIETSGLDWTIVRFMAPKDIPYTGKIKVGFGDTKMNFGVSRADIGTFMVEQLDNSCFVGEMPIIGS